MTLGYDHRLIDGADAGRFLTFVKERLEVRGSVDVNTCDLRRACDSACG